MRKFGGEEEGSAWTPGTTSEIDAGESEQELGGGGWWDLWDNRGEAQEYTGSSK